MLIFILTNQTLIILCDPYGFIIFIGRESKFSTELVWLLNLSSPYVCYCVIGRVISLWLKFLLIEKIISAKGWFCEWLPQPHTRGVVYQLENAHQLWKKLGHDSINNKKENETRTTLKFHGKRKWGYDRLIFRDDVERMQNNVRGVWSELHPLLWLFKWVIRCKPIRHFGRTFRTLVIVWGDLTKTYKRIKLASTKIMWAPCYMRCDFFRDLNNQHDEGYNH